MDLFKKLIAGLMSAAVALASSAALIPASAETAAQSSSASSAASLSISEIAAKASTDYGYKDLAQRSNGSARQSFYNRLLSFSLDFWESDEDVTELYGNRIILNKFDHTGLTSDEAVETYLVFRDDNPLFYFMTGDMLRGSTTLWVEIDAEIASAAYRKTLQQKIVAYIDTAMGRLSGLTTRYERALRINNILVGSLDYAIDSSGNAESAMWAHSIAGAIDHSAGVCETYSKTAQMLINYSGGDAVMVIGKANGGSHAWLVVKMDNGKYYGLDATWNDTAKTSKFFAAGKTLMDSQHTAYSPSNQGKYFLYELPQIPDSDYIPAKYAELLASYEYYIEGETAVVTKYKGSGGSVVIPDELFGFPIAEIGEFAFMNAEVLTSVKLPSGCKKIDAGAFACQYQLKTVTFPEGLTDIGNDAFYGDSKLTGVTLPRSLRRIGSAAFFNCFYSGTREITIPYGVSKIGQYAIGYGYGSGGGSYKFDGDYSAVSKTRLTNFTVKCYSGTKGHDYAKSNGFIIVLLTHTHIYKDTVIEPTYEHGGYTVHICEECGACYSDSFTSKLIHPADVDRSGTVDEEDCRLMRAFLTGGDTGLEETAFDVDGDGKVTMVDYGLMRAVLAGRDIRF